MRILVLTSEPITADQLRDAMRDDLDPRETEVMVVAPALQDNPLKFWFSDADSAIAKAEQVRAETVQRLGEADVSVTGETGESDPFQAIEDALNTFPADRIVLFTHPEGNRRYREDVDEREIEERFGIPVDRAPVSA